MTDSLPQPATSQGSSRAGTRRRYNTAVRVALAVAALWCAGCGKQASEGDKLNAKAVVEHALVSQSYDEFLSSFTAKNRERMYRSDVWIKWWQEKIGKDRAAWKVVEVREDRRGQLVVVTESRKKIGSQQYYILVRDGYSWRISEIESRRE